MTLYKDEADGCGDGGRRLLEEFADLLEIVPNPAVPRIRAALDGGLVFDSRGRHLDLRRLVFDLPIDERNRVLSRIHSACQPPPADCAGFVVLSDVDDTVLPGRDLFKVSGSDRSWVLDGRLYPGVTQTHSELRGQLGRDRDYPVLLTARPPPLVSKLPGKLSELTDDVRPRMAILPGIGGFHVAANAVRIMLHSYAKLAKMKVVRLVQYAWLFPEYGGRFVFIGDDGQGDLAAAADMLRLRAPRRLEAREEEPPSTALDSGASLLGRGPLLAFAAIHAVRDKAGDFVTPVSERRRKVDELRRQFPPETVHGFAPVARGPAKGSPAASGAPAWLTSASSASPPGTPPKLLQPPQQWRSPEPSSSTAEPALRLPIPKLLTPDPANASSGAGRADGGGLTHDGGGGGGGGPGESEGSEGKHLRFFYFEDYADLAQQLAEARWLDWPQCEAIFRAIIKAEDEVGLASPARTAASRSFSALSASQASFLGAD